MVLAYTITLPMPTSVNASHTVGIGFKNPKTKKWTRALPRSAEYTAWLAEAAIVCRQQFPMGVDAFAGRVRVDYTFVWNQHDKAKVSSDIGNREKCLSDFLEGKFFLNDNQIDEQHHYRRIDAGQSRVICRIYEIEDRRFLPI